jgi:glycosyltransferase involved in cell wall biosynthesis
MASTTTDNFFHGHDVSFADEDLNTPQKKLTYFIQALYKYKIFHFANAHGIYFLTAYDEAMVNNKKGLFYHFTHRLFVFFFEKLLRWKLNYLYRVYSFFGPDTTHRLLLKYAHHLPYRWDILLIKKVGGKIAYTNNGCLDGVLKSSFVKWSTPDNNPICSTICHYKDREDICSDSINKKWGEFRNSVADFQSLFGGNRIDYNISDKVHECPEIYNLDKNFWNPDTLIPTNYLLPFASETIKLYHAVGNFDGRNQNGIKTIKSTHIYFDVVAKLKAKGHKVDIIFFKDVPNKILRYYQAQADVFVDMLSYGFFGANIREGLMLGKPCVCYLRPEWLDQMRMELPEYVDELPIINATPQTVETVLEDLIKNPSKLKEIGKKSRAFAVKWHSSEVAAKKFDKIYTNLLSSF